MLIIKLKPKKETPIFKGHPWLFSGAIDAAQGAPEKEGACRVLDSRGHFVCQGMYNPLSQIAIRVLTLGKEPINKEFFELRIKKAIKLRNDVIGKDTTCCRLINAEGDNIPGLIVDMYGDVIVIQFICPGIERFKEDLVDIFHELYPNAYIHERSDIRFRNTEGLRPLSGPLYGELAQGDLIVKEMGLSFVVDVLTGDGTGFYLNNRTNRFKIRSMAKDKAVLDLFSYTGAFSLHALAGGAKSVVSVDSSSPAQAMLKKNMALNQAAPFIWRHAKDDVARFLSNDKTKYDLIICDPPNMAKDQDDYTKINSLAIDRLSQGGKLITTAISGPQFTPMDLLKVINRSARRASRSARIIEPLYQAPDFPLNPSHPQGIDIFGYIVYVD